MTQYNKRAVDREPIGSPVGISMHTPDIDTGDVLHPNLRHRGNDTGRDGRTFSQEATFLLILKSKKRIGRARLAK